MSENSRPTESIDRSESSAMPAWRVAIGLTALWFAGYALPLMGAKATYFRPQGPEVLLIPGVIAALILLPLFWGLQSAAVQRYQFGRWSWMTMLATCTVISVPALFYAADYPWPRATEALFGDDNTGRLKQASRIGVIALAILLTLMLARRGWRQRHAEALSALGLAMLALIIWRQASQAYMPGSFHNTPSIAVTPSTNASPARRVVWVIFDELDAQKIEEIAAKSDTSELPHWKWLQETGITALNANPPARDTVSSIPGLLTGRPVAGHNLVGPGRLNLLDRNTGGEFAFDEASTIFAALPGGPSKGSIAGLYHPYCDIFTRLKHCDSEFLAYASRPTDALTYVLPKFLHPSLDEHYRITVRLLDLLPQRLQDRQSSLVFLHINLPHLPSSWAQAKLGMPRVLDAQGMYAQNLKAVDVVLGRILEILRGQDDPGTLLIISSDHWWRPLSMQRPRPIPFVVWHAGLDRKLSVEAPFSTVHTRALALAWLHGEFGLQATEIANWMSAQPFIPTWVPPTQTSDD